MKFGKDNQSTKRRNNTLTIPIGKDGIGDEKHPEHESMERPVDAPSEEQHENPAVDEVLNKVRSQVYGKPRKKETPQPEESKLKLYLKTPINILFNRREKDPQRVSKWQKLKSAIVNWWRKEKTNDLKDMVKFVFIHGFHGAPATLALLSFTSISMPLLDYIRGIAWLNLIVVILGTGSAYYLFLDVNKFLKDTWRAKK